MDKFLALADPTRRKIIDLLSAGERSAGDLASHFSISSPAVSQHLKALKAAGLVHVRKDAQKRIYYLNPDGLTDVDRWVAHVRRFWNAQLDALEQELDKPD